MNWMPLKHTLFVNRTKAGSFALQLRPCSKGMNNRFEATSEEATFSQALLKIEQRVRAVKLRRGEA